MLVSGVAFSQVVLAIHIAGAVVTFGLVIVWPFISDGVARHEPGALPSLHRTRQQLGRLIVNPGLALMLITGIYLASDLHEWKRFFTQWGLAMVVVLGGLEGAVVIRQEGRLADLSERQRASGPASGRSRGLDEGSVAGADALRARALSRRASWLMAALVLITVYLMVVRA